MTDRRSALPPKFDITPEEVERVLKRFYAGVRQHPELALVFGAHVDDWPAHEEKIGRFWRNAILHEGNYDGFPQRVHLMAPEVKVTMFLPEEDRYSLSRQQILGQICSLCKCPNAT